MHAARIVVARTRAGALMFSLRPMCLYQHPRCLMSPLTSFDDITVLTDAGFRGPTDRWFYPQTRHHMPAMGGETDPEPPLLDIKKVNERQGGHHKNVPIRRLMELISRGFTWLGKVRGFCMPRPKRPAREGEVCSCGRPAVEVVLCDDLGSVPYCGTAGDGHRPPDCPQWCVRGHDLPYEGRHMGENHVIPLDACPQHDRVGGEWQTWFQPLLVGLTKEPNHKSAYIEIIGADNQLAGCLTAYEAEQLAKILLNLTTTLRDEAAYQGRIKDPAPSRGTAAPPSSLPTPD
jgi:hypothetical protein